MTKTLSQTLAVVKAEALGDALAHMLSEVKAKTLSDTLAEVKGKPIVVVLAGWPKVVEPETLSQHWPM